MDRPILQLRPPRKCHAARSLASLCGCGRGDPGAPFPIASTTTRLTSDGSRMVFPRLVGGKWRICMADVASGHVDALTDPPSGTMDVYPEMSPNARVIAFTRKPVVAGFDSLMLYYMDGDSVKTLVSMHGVYRPKWRPDGRMILFGGLVSEGAYMFGYRSPDAFHVAVNDTVRLARRYSWTILGSVLKYEWNRPGTAFACEYDISGAPYIAVCQLGSEKVHVYLVTDSTLVPDCGTQVKTNTEFSPSFTPDGSGVVYASNFVIGRVPVTGSAQVPVEIDTGNGLRCDEFAVWSGDARWLAIEAGNPVNNQLWLRRYGQAKAVQVTAFPNGIARYFAAWSPDSRTVAVMERASAGADSLVQRISRVRGF